MAPKRKRSALWSHFSETENKKAKCLYCSQILALPSGNTCNLNRHMKSKHPTVPLTLERQIEETHQQIAPETSDRPAGDSSRSLLPVASTFVANLAPMPATQVVAAFSSQARSMTITNYLQSTRPIPTRRAEILDEQLITMIAKEYHPIKLVEDVEFRKFIHMLCPGYSLPTRKTLSETLLPRLYTKTLESAKTKIEGAIAVCLTTDGWTSVNNNSFIAVTAHFLLSSETSLKLESILLGCIEFNERHTSVNLRIFLQNLIKEWKINNKITAITTDNAANMTAALREGDWRSISCFAHSLNLCVQSAITHISTTVAKVKSIVEFFKRSSHAQSKLIDMQRQLGLPNLKLKQDVSTRWNSTYDMLSHLMQIKDAVIATVALLKNYLALNEQDWAIIERVVPILETFSNITCEISSEKNVTLSKVIPLCKLMSISIKSRLQASIEMEPIKDLLQKLEQELNRRFCNIESNVLYTEATLLDPRFKQKSFKSDYDFQKAVETLKQNVGRARIRCDGPELCSVMEDTVQNQPSTSIWDEFDKEVAQLKPHNSFAAGIVEVDKYMTEPILQRTKDPFIWWHERRHVYPLLYGYIFKRLNLVATSVPCERIFSKAGYTLNDRRTRLKSKKIVAVTIYKQQ